jgi:hypothetical protein
MADDAVVLDDEMLSKRAAALEAEAGELLAAITEIDAFHHIGPLLVTGSYVSGLMCWRDLDVGALVGSEFTPADVLELAARIIAELDVTAFTYRDERGSRSPTGARRDERYHLPLQVNWKSGGEWRFDLSLWLYDDHANVAAWHRQLRQRLSPIQRGAVLRIKHVWCRRPEYPDEVSGTEIYSAVLDDGVNDADAFDQWLIEHQRHRNTAR